MVHSQPAAPASSYAPKSLLSGIAAVFLWSFAAPIVSVVKGDIPFSVFATIPVAIAWCLFAILVLYDRRAFVRCVRNLSGKQVSVLVMSGTLLAGYEIFFFYALFEGPIVEANVINYLWPIALIVFTVMLDPAQRRDLSIWELTLVAMAFWGAGLTAGSRLTSTGWGDAYGVYLAAFLGALLVGAHMALLRQTRTYMASPIHSYFLAVSTTLVVLVTTFSLLDVALLPPFRPGVLLLIVIEGGLVFGVGYLLWQYSIQNYPSITLASIIYLTPVLTTVWLLLLGEEVTGDTLLGGVLIVVANFLLHSRYRHVRATQGALVTFVMTGLLCATTDPLRHSDIGVVAGVLGVLFSITVGFSLNRLATKHRERDREFSSVYASILDLTNDLPPAPSDERRAVLERIDQVLCQATNLELAISSRNGRAEFMGLLSGMERLRRANQESERLRQHTDRLISALHRWLLLKAERMPLGEQLAIVLLGVTTFALVTVSRDTSFGGDIAAIAIGTGIAFLIFTVRDLDVDQEHITLERLACQFSIFEHIGLSPYVPSGMVETEQYPDVDRPVQVRTIGEEGKLMLVTIYPHIRFYRLVFVMIAAISSSVMVFLLGAKHFGIEWIGVVPPGG